MALLSISRDLGHLDHEGAAPAGEVVARAYAREDAVDHAYARAARRHVGAHLGHEDYQRRLAQVGALAGHVGAGYDREAVGAHVR